VIKSFGALYVGATGNVRYTLSCEFTVVTVEEVCVCWEKRDRVCE